MPEEQKKNKTRVLTQEEIEKIMALPERKFLFGGVQQSGKYDEATNKFYLLRDDGTLDGRIATVTRKDRPPDEPDQSNKEDPPKKKSRYTIIKKPSKEACDTEKAKPPTEDHSTAPDEPDDADTEDDGFKENVIRRRKIIFFASAAAVILLITCALLATILSPAKEAPLPSPPAIESVQPSVTPEKDPDLKEIEVIQVKRDLIPGDVLSEDNIQQVFISAETYNQIYLGNAQLYQGSRAKALIGSYVITYIPQGQYLTYDNVAAVYHQEPNPWYSSTDESLYVTIPLTEDVLAMEDFSYGSVVDLTIRKQIVKEVVAPEDPDAEPETYVPGLDHQTSVQQSYVVDTYGLYNVVICDLLNCDQNSLYSTFTSWISIPAGEQLTYIRGRLTDNEELEEKIIPRYAKIRLSAAQAEELGDLTGDDTEVTFAVKADTDTDTEAKAVYAAQVRALAQTVNTAKIINKELAKEAAE